MHFSLLEKVLYQHESAYQTYRKTKGQPVKIFVDKALDAWTIFPYQPCYEEETGTPADNRRDDEHEEIDLKNTSGNGKYFVWNWCKASRKNNPEIPFIKQ